MDIRTLRKTRRLSLAELATLAGIQMPEMTRLERGLSAPTRAQTKRLACALGVTDIIASASATRGEGYITSSVAHGRVIPRRQEPDGRLRPVWDLFCGTGGFSNGFESAGGFAVTAGVDLLGDRLDTFTTNHASATAFGGDVRNIPTSVLLDGAPSPFVVIGGPPCQGFSSLRPFRNAANEDPRNGLGAEFLRVVADSRPAWVVFENVVGLVRHENGAVLRALLSAFEDQGYRASARVMNAAFHGLPQRRERLIVVASRDGKAFAWPTCTHAHGRRSMAGASPLLHLPVLGADLPPALTFSEATSDLPALRSGESSNRYAFDPLNEFQAALRAGEPPLTLHKATVHSEAMLNVIRHAGNNIGCLPPGLVKSGFSSCYSRLAADEPANTVTVNFVHPASNRCIHPTQDRALTPREGARLQGFTDGFAFRGTRSQVVKQIGNAVPPLLGRVIAYAILESD